MVKKKQEKFIKSLGWTRENTAFFFLGIGFIMFLLNITTMINLMGTKIVVFPIVTYITSVASSIVLMIYSLYNIYR